jgi:hypothetical protein
VPLALALTTEVAAGMVVGGAVVAVGVALIEEGVEDTRTPSPHLSLLDTEDKSMAPKSH